MPDPIWIDSCAIIDIAQGDTALEAEMLARRNAKGGKILMTPKVQEEVLLGNPFKRLTQKEVENNKQWEIKPETREAQKKVIQRMNIELDTMGSREDRQKFKEIPYLELNEQKKSGVKILPIEESDAIVVSEIAASAKARNVKNPELHTTENRLVNNGSVRKLWGVTVIKLIPPSPPSSGSGGGQGSPKGPPPTPIVPLPPNSGKTMIVRGLVTAGLTSVGLILMGALAQHLRQKLEQEMIVRQLKELEPEILIRLAKLKEKRASIQADGGQPSAVINIEILVVTHSEYGNGRPIKDASLPVVSLESVEIRRFSVAASAGKPKISLGTYGTTQERTLPFQWSVSVPLSPTDLQEFIELKKNLEWCQSILKEPQLPKQDRERIQKDLNELQLQYQRWAVNN